MLKFKKWLDSIEPEERGGVITLIIIVLVISVFGLGVQLGRFYVEFLL